MIKSGTKVWKVALIGNPNCGKSTVFNQLTGLRQKTGNFPGVTVDVKEGALHLPNGLEAILYDFPGTYSLYPTSSDERIVSAVLTNQQHEFYPDILVYVADVTNLEKHLLLFSQLLDLQFPLVLALNMSDVAAEEGLLIQADVLSRNFNVPVVSISGRTGANIPDLMREIGLLLTFHMSNKVVYQRFHDCSDVEKQVVGAVQQNLGMENAYMALLTAHHHDWLPHLTKSEQETLAAIVATKGLQSLRAQVDETLDRFDKFVPIVKDAIKSPPVFPVTATDRLDAVMTHRFWGPVLFFSVMLLLFQAIFDWSQYPMDAIEGGFASLNGSLRYALGDSWFTRLLTDGILSGLSGILVFVPQIAILFLLITVLEEVGYMARVVFMFDRIMRRFGMNGRSVVALISGGACAVPAIMSSRTIGNWKERLITVLVTPFISCSARLPVYSVLIALAIPSDRVLGIFSWQSLTFAGMYVLGVVVALGAGWLMKKYLRTREPSYLAIQLPVYRMPYWKNVWLTVWEKVWAFISGAGKVIVVISLVLWALSNFGPGDSMEVAAETAWKTAHANGLDDAAIADAQAASKLEASWAGQLGKSIEWAIKPLGYDWKIGIALVTSFAAREVFVGTMSTLYSIGSAEDDALLRVKMASAVWPDGSQVYTLATAMSLLVFYALAMQCMSTLVVVKKETGGWKWAIFQFVFMGLLAYFSAFIVYQLLR